MQRARLARARCFTVEVLAALGQSRTCRDDPRSSDLVRLRNREIRLIAENTKIISESALRHTPTNTPKKYFHVGSIPLTQARWGGIV
jgi:hypothetical protein